MEGTEKIYCMDKGNSCLETAALMNGGMNNWNNNPFIYLVWIMMMRYMNGNGWGENGGAENFNSRQLASLQDTINTNHNNEAVLAAMRDDQSAVRELAQTFNCDINTMQQAICGVKSAVERVGGEVGFSSEKVINGVLLGNKDLTSALQSCCCENKLLTTQQGYENRIATLNQTNTLQAGQTSIATAINEARSGLANGLQQGFSSVAYESQKQTCDIINAGNANTQRIIDTLNNHWSLETSQNLQDAKFELSQLKQNMYLVNTLKTA